MRLRQSQEPTLRPTNTSVNKMHCRKGYLNETGFHTFHSATQQLCKKKIQLYNIFTYFWIFRRSTLHVPPCTCGAKKKEKCHGDTFLFKISIFSANSINVLASFYKRRNGMSYPVSEIFYMPCYKCQQGPAHAHAPAHTLCTNHPHACHMPWAQFHCCPTAKVRS